MPGIKKIVRYGCDLSAARRIPISIRSSEPVQHSFSRYHNRVRRPTGHRRIARISLVSRETRSSSLDRLWATTATVRVCRLCAKRLDSSPTPCVTGQLTAHHRPCHRRCDSYRQKCIVSPQIPTHLTSLLVSYIYSSLSTQTFPQFTNHVPLSLLLP